MNTKKDIKKITRLDNFNQDQKKDWQTIMNFITEDLVFMDTFLLQGMMIELQVEIDSRYQK